MPQYLKQDSSLLSKVVDYLVVCVNDFADADDHNRDNRYDLVVGPVADDDLVLLFRQFERNLISVETLVREMQFKRLTIQYSFHTPSALSFLKFVEAKDVR